MEESEEYDEFLMESIQRYNTLQMFNLENVPQHLLRVNENSLCVSSHYEKRNTSELLILQLPEKLILPAEEEGRSKGNDFKVLKGLYTENTVYKIDNLLKSGKLVTSEMDVTGLKIYSLEKGKKDEANVNIVPWCKCDFVIIKESNDAICSKCCHEPIIQIDMNAGKEVKEMKHPALEVSPNCNQGTSFCDKNNIKCSVIDENLIAVMNSNVGNVFIHDLRTNDCFVTWPTMKGEHSKGVWVLSECDSQQKSCDYFGILSSSRSICIFDKRKNSILVEHVGADAPNIGNMKLKFSQRGDRFSISGLDSVVDVYQVENCNVRKVFSHDGHSPNKSGVNSVTDHIWLQTVSKELIVSICNNKTLNCWDYNAE